MSQVANTILEQLGGTRFVVMTGAKNFLGGENHLSFQLPSKPHYTRDKINYVKITLDVATDTYRMNFSRYIPRKLQLVTISEEEGVYAEDLRKFFESATGLRTHLF